MAVVVDVVDKRGAVRVFEKDGDKRVVAVGTQDAGNMVIVPWDSKWWLRASGSVDVGYVVKKTDKKSDKKT